MDTFDVEINFILHLNKAHLDKVLKESKEFGHGYGDPGKKELVKRLVMNEGLSCLEELLQDPRAFTYTLKKLASAGNVSQHRQAEFLAQALDYSCLQNALQDFYLDGFLFMDVKTLSGASHFLMWMKWKAICGQGIRSLTSSRSAHVRNRGGSE